MAIKCKYMAYTECCEEICQGKECNIHPDHVSPEQKRINALETDRDHYKAEAERLQIQVDLYNTWMDGKTHCPPYGVPVLGYLQRSMDIEYEIDIVFFELTERWKVATTMEEVDVLFWRVLPEPPSGGWK